ncbi:hypothetical protein GCM10010885_04500 [Alicyclobacillus cellulosilyticus]|uniref:Peptidase S11 D-alanyl-D-alanine carboxypeptidase A N-terminal domain-containing protein n=1 Tax=Alicyclobacillus cellulosilyticus TaxID=1003997 RepID=A0A917K3W7_9BACL|nr:D-alanyl-D-alanine carboxypeptidase [Alicyclobacillus cellulosilyticus]GGI97972.1 hypothetical protein GCM10010885_04500 [Alicyclobacillus cellulosilyticus]
MRKTGLTILGVLLLILILAVVQVFRPLPMLKIQPAVAAVQAVPGTVSFHWPTTGQAVVGIEGVGLMGQYGPETPVPIASLTKMMTALLVLEKHPLQPGEEGPVLTVTPADVAVYERDKKAGESVMKVVAGERLTERQLLEGLLLPSANNIATMLANWVAGDEASFVRMMNQKARALGMVHTTYADASGANPQTVSTALDQYRVAELVMQNPVLREIVRMPQATLPVAGTVYNVDAALGRDGIIGIKTGSSLEAGGCFAFAAEGMIENQPVTVMGVVLGQGGMHMLDAALTEARTLANDARRQLRLMHVAQPGQVVGTIRAPWGDETQVVARSGATVIAWPGMWMEARVVPGEVHAPVPGGASLGVLRVTAGRQTISVPLVTTAPIASPPYPWRLLRLK